MAPAVGQTLRSARTSRGIELDDVERATKIRVKFLQAMEDDRWDRLPGAAYARGFLATYARYLDLDDQALVAEYKRLHEDAESTSAYPRRCCPSADRSGHPRSGRAWPCSSARSPPWPWPWCWSSPCSGIGRRRRWSRSAEREEAPRGVGEPEPSSPAFFRAEPARSSVRLRSTGTVWVCLLDGTGDPLVNGETLNAGEERGPFEAYSFDVTFGNGGVEMEVDGKPVDIPDAAEPIGYEISEGSARELGAAAHPTCS